jgi:ATP-dependent DNA helicase RecG
MMNTTVDDIWQLIRAGRGQRVEWFAEDTPVETLAEALASLANAHGGSLLMGVHGTGSIVGCRNVNESVDNLLQAVLKIEPQLIVAMPQIIRISGKSVVLMQIPMGMPHVYALSGRYWQRQGTANLPLGPAELRRLIVERGEASFETEVVRAASQSDLDWDKVKAYAAALKGMSEHNAEQILLKRGCLVEHEGTLKPTHAGILLFGRDPQRFLRGADITAVRFAGESMSDTFSRQDISGTLPDQIKRAETFLVDHLRKNMQLGQTMARAEHFEYPMEAARELVVNAVAHRDYRINGDGIRLFVFSNRMEVTSPGGLPGPVTIANIKDERFSRNPAIVQVLSDLGYIERLGYGVDRVIDLMRMQRLQEPEFEETGGGFKVILRNAATEVPKIIPTSTKPALLFNGVYNGVEINPRQEAALTFLHENHSSRITNSDLQALCPDVHPETIRRDLADLVTKQILQKMGQKRGSYYVLTRQTEAEAVLALGSDS